ncbi:S41 family peptidase [Achromobacter xylosoxidans]
MMTGLDPYSRVASRAELAPPPASVGLELSIRDGALTVVRPLPGGPGEQAGIQAGDILTRVDGRATAGLPLPEAVALLRGAPGTRPMLTLRRPGTAGAIMAQPVRGPVQAPPTVRWELDGAVAVIRNSAFDSRTGGQLRDAVDAAATRCRAAGGPGAGPARQRRRAARRGRGGRRPGAARRVRDRQPARPRPDNVRALRARDPLVPRGVPMVVLVDGRTAAGAEIVAAALQDHGRALLIGAKTLGAGTIQTVLPLPAGQGALIVTTHRVHRASGARLDGTGVAPDMRLDEAKRRITVRDDIAADFNGALAQRVRDAVAGAPAGADVALLAARAALAHATAD